MLRYSRNTAVLVLALTAAGIAGAVSAGEPDLGLADLPGLPGSVLRSSGPVGDTGFDAEYWVWAQEEASPAQRREQSRRIAEDCLERMAAAGWTLRRENRQPHGGEFDLRKDVVKDARVTVGPRAKPVEGRMRPYVSVRFELRRRLPPVDIKGVDHPDVPRYPGSVRVKWMDLLGDYSAKFLVLDPVESVRDFFESESPRHGWVASRGVGTLNYTKGGVQSPEEVSGEAVKDPVGMVAGLIPSTLAVHLGDAEGITEIGIGRSAGAGDSQPSEPPAVTPPRGPREETAGMLTFIDPEKDLPVFEGLRLEGRESRLLVTSGDEVVRLSYLKEDAPMEEALQMAGFYRREMEARGWEFTDEEWHGIGRKLDFRRGAVKTRVSIKAVGRWPLPERRPNIRIPVEILVTYSIPTREVAGEDIADVPRFSGSVRFYYLRVATDTVVKFKALGSVDEAEWFFIETLPEHGWRFAGNDRTGLLFVPASTAGSAADALASGQLVPTTLKVVVDDGGDGTLKIGMDLTRGG